MNRVLFCLASEGHAVQEPLIPSAELRDAGMRVEYATWDAEPVRFDPVCAAMAYVEALWSPALWLHRRARRDGWLDRRLRLRDWERSGMLDRFDAVVVPGGHGPVFGAFVRNPELRRILAAFADSGRIVGLLCHSVAAAGPLAKGRNVTCWPGSYERILGAIPLAGPYLAPLGPSTEELVAGGGARVRTSMLPWRMPLVVTDGDWITGWGPWSSRRFALELIRRLEEKNGRRAA